MKIQISNGYRKVFYGTTGTWINCAAVLSQMPGTRLRTLIVDRPNKAVVPASACCGKYGCREDCRG
jgi:hypothetical protein